MRGIGPHRVLVTGRNETFVFPCATEEWVGRVRRVVGPNTTLMSVAGTLGAGLRQFFDDEGRAGRSSCDVTGREVFTSDRSVRPLHQVEGSLVARFRQFSDDKGRTERSSCFETRREFYGRGGG